MRVRGWVSRISDATEMVYRGLSRSNPGSRAPIERALTDAPTKAPGFAGYSFLSQPALHAAGEVRRRGLALDQVLERPQLETSLDELLLAVVGEDDHRDVSRLLAAAKPFQHGEAVHLGQTDVQEDDVRLDLVGEPETLLPILGHDHLIAVKLQFEPVHLGHRRIVFDEEDPDLITRMLTSAVSHF